MSDLGNISSPKPCFSAEKLNNQSVPPTKIVDLDTKNTYVKSLSFKELIDTKKINALLKSNGILEVYEEYINGKKWTFDDKKSLKKILTKTALDNTMDVKYTSQTPYGRVYPVGCLSIGQMKREIRHYLCKDTYYDIDIKNAHPIILTNICDHYDIPCDKLKEYCSNRKKIIKDYKKKYGMSRDDTKKLYIAMINCGNYQSHFPAIHKKTQKRHAKAFYNEMNTIVKLISKKNKALRLKLLENIDNPWDGSFMSRYLQMYEFMCLEEAYKYCMNEKIIGGDNSCVLCHDGIMIPKSQFENEAKCSKFLAEKLNAHIYKTLGLRLEFVVKPMNEDYIIKDGKNINIATELKIQNIDATEEYWDEYRLKYGIGKNEFPKSSHDYDLAKLFYKPQEDEYVFTKIGNNKCGFKFNKYGLFSSIGFDRLSNVVVEYFQPLLDNLNSVVAKKIHFLNNNPPDNAEEHAKQMTVVNDLQKLTNKITEKVNNTASLMKIVTRIVQHYTVDRFQEKMDTDSNIIGFDNGIIDLNDIDAGVKPASKEKPVTMSCGYNYCKADSKIKQEVYGIIRSIFPDKETTDEVLLILSRSLTGKNIEEIFMACKGKGGNGKGLLMDFMKLVLGDYYEDMKSFVLTKDPKKEGTTLSAHLYGLRKARIINISEPPNGVPFNTNTFKGMTGRDGFKVRTLYIADEIVIEFCPMVCMRNCDYGFTDDTESDAMKRRLIGLHFPYSFKSKADIDLAKQRGENISMMKVANHTLKDKMKQSQYKCAFMDILLEHYKRYLEREEPKIRPTKFMIKSTEMLSKNLSPDKDWFNENLIKDGEEQNKKNYLVRPLFEKYRRDEQSNQSFHWFKKKLEEFGYKYHSRITGLHINTKQEKQGACVLNVEYIGNGVENDTIDWLEEDK